MNNVEEVIESISPEVKRTTVEAIIELAAALDIDAEDGLLLVDRDTGEKHMLPVGAYMLGALVNAALEVRKFKVDADSAVRH